MKTIHLFDFLTFKLQRMNTTTLSATSREKALVIADVFSQAITGEIIGMSNFAALTETIEDYHEKMEAVEHANSERMHAEAFIAYALQEEMTINIQPDGTYWGGMRKQFLSYAEKKDFIACLIIQEVMLESFAVSMYTDVGNALGGEAGELFLRIAGEEREHLAHSSDILRSEMQNNPVEFLRKFEEIHFRCMTILASFSASTDLQGHCGVCNGSCMKESLHHIDLNIRELRGNAMALYADALDNIGIPGEISTVWLAKLPA